MSYHRSHRRVPHHMKRISSQGCWIILIGCITYGGWKPGDCFPPIYLVLIKGDLWSFLRHIFNQTNLLLRATSDTTDIADTSDSDTDTPFPLDTSISSFSGSGISWFDNKHILTDNVICWLPAWFLNGEAGRRRRVSEDTHWRVE